MLNGRSHHLKRKMLAERFVTSSGERSSGSSLVLLYGLLHRLVVDRLSFRAELRHKPCTKGSLLHRRRTQDIRLQVRNKLIHGHMVLSQFTAPLITRLIITVRALIGVLPGLRVWDGSVFRCGTRPV